MKKWMAFKKNKEFISEEDINWHYVKDDISGLSLDNNGQIIDLPDNMDSYVQGKTASTYVGSSNVDIESRYIGFVKNNILIKIRVNENTNNISVEVENIG